LCLVRLVINRLVLANLKLYSPHQKSIKHLAVWEFFWWNSLFSARKPYFTVKYEIVQLSSDKANNKWRRGRILRWNSLCRYGLSLVKERKVVIGSGEHYANVPMAIQLPTSLLIVRSAETCGTAPALQERGFPFNDCHAAQNKWLSVTVSRRIHISTRTGLRCPGITTTKLKSKLSFDWGSC